MHFDNAMMCLENLKFISNLTFASDNKSLLATIRTASTVKGDTCGSKIWRYGIDGSATQLTDGRHSDSSPTPSPVDDTVAFLSDRRIRGKMELNLLDRDLQVTSVAEVDGSVEQIAWSKDGSFITALAADRGLVGGATSGGLKLWWGEPQDPEITVSGEARRRLIKFDIANRTAVEVGPKDFTVWEFCLVPGGALAVVSKDASERGWHHPKLALIDFSSRGIDLLYESDWQIQGLTCDPEGRHVAFLEGWSSDRGLVAGEVSMIEIETHALTRVTADSKFNITSLKWRNQDSLFFAGWKGLGSIYGTLSLDGKVTSETWEEASVGESTFVARVSISGCGSKIAAVREAIGCPQEIFFRRMDERDWNQVTQLNVAVAANYPSYPEVRHVRWKGKDGLELESFLLVPLGIGPGPHPMIVDIHGGPCTSSKYSFDPAAGLGFAAAGYVVFVPNYRGNVGWGQKFTRMNIGDPAGAEFDDILAGVDHCISLGVADPDKLGITGRSYGGFLTAWAVAVTDRFKAAIPVASICNQISVHYSGDNDFHEFINGGSLREPRYRKLALERSPILRLDRPKTPTLLIQGMEDKCTPLGQAQEFFSALQERDVVSELVAYPREGHGFREREHRIDAWKRRVAWFDRFLRTSDAPVTPGHLSN